MTDRSGHADACGHQQQSLVLTIDLTRSLVAALLVTAVAVAIVLLARSPAPASAAGEAVSAATDSMRRYYLGGPVMANVAIDGCASGYHFASLWEILDPSNLVYNNDLGVDAPDSGEGPPTTWTGWVRTGYNTDHGAIVGHANCDGWTSISGIDHYGTTARLPSSWSAGGELHVWDVNLQDCAVPGHIWCVED